MSNGGRNAPEWFGGGFGASQQSASELDITNDASSYNSNSNNNNNNNNKGWKKKHRRSKSDSFHGISTTSSSNRKNKDKRKKEHRRGKSRGELDTSSLDISSNSKTSNKSAKSSKSAKSTASASAVGIGVGVGVGIGATNGATNGAGTATDSILDQLNINNNMLSSSVASTSNRDNNNSNNNSNSRKQKTTSSSSSYHNRSYTIPSPERKSKSPSSFSFLDKIFGFGSSGKSDPTPFVDDTHHHHQHHGSMNMSQPPVHLHVHHNGSGTSNGNGHGHGHGSNGGIGHGIRNKMEEKFDIDDELRPLAPPPIFSTANHQQHQQHQHQQHHINHNMNHNPPYSYKNNDHGNGHGHDNTHNHNNINNNNHALFLPQPPVQNSNHPMMNNNNNPNSRSRSTTAHSLPQYGGLDSHRHPSPPRPRPLPHHHHQQQLQQQLQQQQRHSQSYTYQKQQPTTSLLSQVVDYGMDSDDLMTYSDDDTSTYNPNYMLPFPTQQQLQQQQRLSSVIGGSSNSNSNNTATMSNLYPSYLSNEDAQNQETYQVMQQQRLMALSNSQSNLLYMNGNGNGSSSSSSNNGNGNGNSHMNRYGAINSNNIDLLPPMRQAQVQVQPPPHHQQQQHMTLPSLLDRKIQPQPLTQQHQNPPPTHRLNRSFPSNNSNNMYMSDDDTMSSYHTQETYRNVDNYYFDRTKPSNSSTISRSTELGTDGIVGTTTTAGSGNGSGSVNSNGNLIPPPISSEEDRELLQQHNIRQPILTSSSGSSVLNSDMNKNNEESKSSTLNGGTNLIDKDLDQTSHTENRIKSLDFNGIVLQQKEGDHGMIGNGNGHGNGNGGSGGGNNKHYPQHLQYGSPQQVSMVEQLTGRKYGGIGMGTGGGGEDNYSSSSSSNPLMTPPAQSHSSGSGSRSRSRSNNSNNNSKIPTSPLHATSNTQSMKDKKSSSSPPPPMAHVQIVMTAGTTTTVGSSSSISPHLAKLRKETSSSSLQHATQPRLSRKERKRLRKKIENAERKEDYVQYLLKNPLDLSEHQYGSQKDGSVNPYFFPKEDNKPRDVLFAILFLAQLSAVIFLATRYAGGTMLHSSSISMPVEEDPYMIENDDPFSSGSPLPDENESPISIWAKDIYVDYTNAIQLSCITALYATVLSALSIAMMMILSTAFITTILCLTIIICVGFGLIMLALSPYTVLPVLGIAALAISLAYSIVVWDRIPFASTNLHTALQGMKSSADILLVGFGMMFVAFFWTMTWMIAFLGIYDHYLDNANHELSNNISWVGLAVSLGMFISYVWTFNVIMNIVHVTVAGVVGTWWTSPNSLSSCCTSVCREHFLISMTKSLGSICLGSLVVPPLGILHFFLLFICPQSTTKGHSIQIPVSDISSHDGRSMMGDKSVKSDSMSSASLYPRMSSPLDGVTRYFNDFGFTYIGIYRNTFVASSEKATEVFRARDWSGIVADRLIPYVLKILSILITVSSGLFGLVVEEYDGYRFTNFSKPTSTAFIIGCFVGYVLSSVCLKVVESSVSTVLVCFSVAPYAFKHYHPILSSEMRASWGGVWLDEMALSPV